MNRLILVAAVPNRFFQHHNVSLGQWVITDPLLSTVKVQASEIQVHAIIDVQEAAMRCDRGGQENCFLTNPSDPLFTTIKNSVRYRNGQGFDTYDSFGPVFKLRTNQGVIRWFVATSSGRHALRNLPLEVGSSFRLNSTFVTSAAGYSYYVPRIIA